MKIRLFRFIALTLALAGLALGVGCGDKNQPSDIDGAMLEAEENLENIIDQPDALSFKLTKEHFDELLEKIAKDKDELTIFIVDGKESNNFIDDEELFDGKFDTDDLGLLFYKYRVTDYEKFIKKYNSETNPVSDDLLGAVRREIRAIYGEEINSFLAQDREED